MKIKKESKDVFFRSSFVSITAIICISLIYIGGTLSYEQMCKMCFGDDRPAVIVREDYIKFFSIEFTI